MPKSKRPSLKRSTVATSSAISKGLPRGRTCTAVPTRSRRERAAMKLASASGEDCTERAPLKWISPSHTPSSPHASPASARSSASRNASDSPIPRRRSSTKMPKCMVSARRVLRQELRDGLLRRGLMLGLLPALDQRRVGGEGGELSRRRLGMVQIVAEQHEHRRLAAADEVARYIEEKVAAVHRRLERLPGRRAHLRARRLELGRP